MTMYREPSKQYFVYFMSGSSPDAPIKIGFSRNIKGRLKDFSDHHHEPLKVLAKFPGARREERIIHLAVSDDCIRREWFRPSESLLSMIKKIKRTKKMPDIVLKEKKSLKYPEGSLLREILAHLERTGEGRYAWGQRVLKDKAFLWKLEHRARIPYDKTKAKIKRAIARKEASMIALNARRRG